MKATRLLLRIAAIAMAAGLLTACGPRPVVISQCPDAHADSPSASGARSDDPGAALIEGTEAFRVGELPVILKHTPGKPVVAAALYVKGGSRNLTAQDAGIESALFELISEGGSTSLERDEMHRALDMMGTSFSAGADRAYSTFALQAIRPNWDRSFEIFADVILHPALPADEFERQRVRAIEFLESLSEDSDRFVSVLAQDLLFRDHPYANRQWGSVENFQRFTLDDLRAYHERTIVTSRLLLVVVGDVTRADLEGKLAPFAALPRGDYTETETPPFQADQTRFAPFTPKSAIPTAYVIGFYAAPAPGHPDYYPMVAASSLLSERLFEKVRTKLDLSYAVSSGLASNPANYGYLYATSSYPSHALAQVFDEVETMQDWLVNATELEQQVASFITDYYLGLETQSAQRNTLAWAQLAMGDWKRSAELITELRKVTPQDVRRVMQTYVKNLHIGYIGDPALISDALTQQAPGATDRALLEKAGYAGPQLAH